MIHCDQVGGLALSDARVSNMAVSGEDDGFHRPVGEVGCTFKEAM